MSATRVTALRTVLRPGRLPSGGTSRILAQTRLATTSPPDPRKQADGVQDNGPVKEFNKDGTNPNKNLAYIGAGALALGGIYVFWASKPDQATGKGAPPAR